MSSPLGLRLNNPLNIRKSSITWEGKAAVQPNEDFVSFIDAHHGIRAAAKNLLTYYRKYKLKTVQGIVTRWAPPDDDNDTATYITRVAQRLQVQPDVELDLEDPEVLKALIVAMMPEEIGTVPYDAETISTAVEAAYSSSSPRAAPSPAPVQTQKPVVGPKVFSVQSSIQPAVPQPNAYGETPVPPLVDQPSSLPSRKVQAAPIGGLAGMPVAFIVATLWNKWLPDTPMDALTAIAIASGISSATAFLAAYMTRNRATVVPPEYTYPSISVSRATNGSPQVTSD